MNKKTIFSNGRLSFTIILTMGCFLCSLSSFAQVWSGGATGLFLTAGNWTPNATFASTETFTMSASGSIITLDGPFNGTTKTCTNIKVTNGATLTTTASADIIASSASGQSNVDNATFNVNGGSVQIKRLYLAVPGAVVNVTAGTLKGANDVWRIGDGTTAGIFTVNVTGGIFEYAGGSTNAIGIGRTTAGVNGFLNISGGEAKISGGFMAVSNSTSIVNIATGGTLTYSSSGSLVTAGTININGGLLSMTNATPSVNLNGNSTIDQNSTGVINIDGGGTFETTNATSTLTLGNDVSGSMTTVNVNNGTMKIGGTGVLTISAPSGTYTGLINIDAGSIILTGDQVAAVNVLKGATVGGIKAVTGKTISVAYDGTKTTVVAVAAPLGVNDVKLDANAILVYAQNQGIKIQSGNVILSDVKVYDLNGHLVASKKSIGSNETSIALNASKAVYVVKVTTADGAVVTKKIVQ